jgi:hypothetical protein
VLARRRALARESIDARMPAGFLLSEAIVSVGLPGGVVLKESTFADLKTSPSGATVTARLSSHQLKLFFEGVYVEGALVDRTDVKKIEIGLSAGYIIPTVETAGGIGLDASSTVWLELHAWLKAALGGVLPLGTSTSMYDAFADPDPQATAGKILDALVKHASSGSKGSGGLTADKVTVRSVGARVRTTAEIKQEQDGAGIVIPASTVIGLTVEGGGTIAGLTAAQTPQQMFDAAKVKRVRLTSAGITVVKDGKPVASITEITLAGGKVKVTGLQLLGEALEAAETEAGLRALASILAGQAAGMPPELAKAKTILDNPQATLVPGITRAKIETALQKALDDFVAKHGSTLGGVDLSSVLGHAPATVP